MALIRPGGLAQVISGGLGALTFARQGSQPIVRTRPIPRAPTSARALSNQALFAQARRAWQHLATSDKLRWERAAPQFSYVNRVGLSRQKSPFALFVGLAMRNLGQGLPTPSAPAAPGNIDLATPINVTLWPGGPAQIAYEGEYNYAFPNVTIEAQRLVSTSPSLPGQLWRVVYRDVMEDCGINFWDELCAAFGEPQPLEWYRLRVTQWITAWPRKAVSTFTAQIPNVGPEKIYNGTFTIDGSPPAGWLVNGPGFLTRDDYFPYSDGWSAYWEHAVSAAQASFYSWIPGLFSLSAGHNYTVRFAKKIEAYDISKIVIEGTGMSPLTVHTGGAESFTPWRLYSYSWTQSANAINCYIRFYSLASVPAEVYFDTVSIREDL